MRILYVAMGEKTLVQKWFLSWLECPKFGAANVLELGLQMPLPGPKGQNPAQRPSEL